MSIPSFFAQAAAGPGAGEFIQMVIPLVLIMAVFYFLLIRPQQKKAKDHQSMLSTIAKGDTVVTHGGLIGKVVKVVDDNELQVEVGENVKVRVLRGGIYEVRGKNMPAPSAPAKPAAVK
jgi:preprotein translocase subunit YajC